MSYNQISNIDDNAFSGIEKAVRYLDLEHNNLMHLPVAFKGLTYIGTLLLLNNPLVNLDGTIMAKISSQLYHFSVSIDRFSSFPDELQSLTDISTLIIGNIKLPVISSTALKTIANSLTWLEMSYANFYRIPAFFCQFNSLQSFISKYSPNLSKLQNGSIFDECSQSMSTLTNLILQRNQLTTFPKIASIFPRLKTLDLSYNAIYSIESRSLVGLNSLTVLHLEKNRLARIPSAINKATHLKELYVQYNQINTLEDFDLFRFHKLTSITMNGNTLTYVSPDAFTHSPLLERVDMHDTYLGHIPRAILGLQHLSYFWLNGQPIPCSCDAMSYLKTWNITNVHIYATCSNGKPVDTYLKTDLPNCP